jgi:fibro-slime domain-containing protein
MKTKIKRHSRSVLSVVLALCMLVSCMTAGMIMTDAAKVDSESVGYDTYYVKGDWDKAGDGTWIRHNITSSGYSVALEANKTYSFVFMANNDQFASNTTIKNSTDYNFSKNDNASITLQTAAAGSYVFSFKGMDGGQTSMSVHIEFPVDTTPTTWTAVGDNTAIFGTAWSPTANANDLEKDSTGSMWRKTWNGVQLTNGSTVKYKVAKNHAWTTTYPSSDATATVPGTSGTGLYNVTVTYDESTNAVNMTFVSAVTYTLKVPTVENAVVKASYNGNTVNEGGTLSGIPAGANVAITVTPDVGKTCQSITATPNATITDSGKDWTLVMPSANVTNLAFTWGSVLTKKVYFNNSYTLYAQVYAYAYNKDGSTKTYECLGAYPGTTMTKLDNSNIWYIEVPNDVNYIEFISGEGYSTGEMQIPWSSYTYPKYTAPYGHNDAPTTANGGTWGNYIYGSDNKRTNEYTVSKGSTMSASNLFTGITATMYDYYTDSEVTNGWLNIASNEYSKGSNGAGWKWNPYTKLNSALSAYADNTVQPKYDVTTPLYFGNLNTWSDNGGGNAIGSAGLSDKATIEGYYHWNLNANSSIQLSNSHNAVTGLSGKTLAGSTIHYYDGDATNENGAPMAMFDEDFLSGENNQNTALATILRTSAFPVRQTTEGATTTYPNKIYVQAKNFDPGSSGELWAHFYGGGSGDNKMSYDATTGYYSCDIPTGATEVIFVRQPISNPSQINWGDEWNESAACAVPTSNTDANRLYVFNNYSGKCQHNKDQGHFNVEAIASSFGTTSGGHVYYEFDSTDGKDNAYITDINQTNKTANINYYANSPAVYSGGTNPNTKGFFPFDKDNGSAKDLGFGMKLVIPFNLTGSGAQNGINEDGTPQTFDFSGDDDLWVFVDDKLVLDLGGAHGRTTGSINFKDKTVTATQTQKNGSATRNASFGDGFNTNANYVHTMTIYYMERGMFESNLKFGFSFHAIPNQFWIDKKIRTKDIINAGFYQNNDQTGAASNKDDTLTDREGRFISKFEASYQNEQFTVTHKVGDTPAANKRYTIDNDTNTYTTDETGTYPIKHDLGNAFIAQFATGDTFNLKETAGNNKYMYTPVFSVWDQANNDKAVTYTGDNTNGYTFAFSPTSNVSGDIENTNIKARFENFMKAHSLTLTKKTNNPADTTSEFTMKVLFDFENDGNYIAYPLYCDLDGVRTQLSKTGEITVKQGQILEIEEIPENAKIQVTETLPNDSAYTYSGTDLAYTSGIAVVPNATVTSGIQFRMGIDDMKVTVNNAQADPVMVFHDLKPNSVGDADTYVTAVVTNAAGTETKVTYDKTPGRITIDPQYLKKDSTDKIVITLETTPIGAYAFEKFWEDIRSTMEELKQNGVNYKADIDPARMTATVTINVKDLFNSTTGAQLYTELPFYSSLLDLQRNLTITKKLTTGTDADTAFTVHVTKNGEPYTGAYKMNGTAATTTTGVFTMHQNDTITIEGLRVGENVSVFETDIPFNYEFSKATLGTDDDTNVASEGTTGYAFTVSEDTALTIWNAPIKYSYEIWYNYSSYRYLHKEQRYKITGEFDANTEKVSDYLEVSNEVEDWDSQTNPLTKVKAYWFKDDNARKNFINILGPYENNFMKKISWNTDMRTSSNTSGVTIRYQSSKHHYIIDVYANVAEYNGVDLTFKLPYKHGVEAASYAAVPEGDGKIKYDTAQPNVYIPNLNYGSWYATNGKKYGEEDTPTYVSAPMVIYNGEQPMGFKYWTVETVATDLYPSVEYTKCYFRDFNLSIYQDSIVTPHYENITAEEAANYHPNPHDVAIADGNANGAVVTFLENSRNQYNVINNNISAASRRNRGDRIYTDFVLSYASESDLKFQDYADGEYTAGLAIQRVALLDDKDEGKNTDSAHYATLYGDKLTNMTYNGAAFTEEELETFIKGPANVNVDNTKGLERSQFDANKLDNKNRIQYYYSYSVRKHTDLTDNGNKDYVYRAFAFMKDKNNNVTMVSQPLYFTFYDMASIANAKEGYDVDFPSTP